MTIQDKDCCGTSSNMDLMDDNRVCSDIGSQSGNAVQMKENYSSGDENTPKARKPYTITKQRERWTEEEHSKFLEALRLYGRTWRRIEEHIGSKTAVQIRSHAQKFFSKVVRESGSDDTGSVKPIEIPPPRPKRKPVHPYPRKLVNSNKKRNLVSDQIDRSVSPNLSVSEHENGSPTSVLSAPGSEVMGSTLSEPHRCSQSPSSSGAGSKPDGSLSTKQDNGSPSSSALPEEENGSSCGSVKRQSSMEHDFYPKDAASEGGHVADAPTVSLKLFGKTVLVTDSHRPSSSSSSGTARSSITENEQENCNKNDVKISETSHFYSTLNNCMVGSDISSWSPYNPSVYCTMPFQNSHMNHMEASAASLHCWAMYGSFPYPYMQSNSIQMPALEERTENQQELRAEKSADSIYIEREISSDKSEKEVDLLLCLKPSKAVESTAGKMNSRGSLKGFVPYKRCYTENNGQSMGIVAEEKDGQRIRLCL